MKTGLIIVFNSFENFNLKSHFIDSINKIKDAKVCLVCANPNEEAFEGLAEIADQCENANVINIKRNKSKTSSVRAGARFLSNKYNLKHLGFIAELSDLEILEVLKTYLKRQEKIVALNQEEQKNKAVKQTFFQSLFSVQEYLKIIASGSII